MPTTRKKVIKTVYKDEDSENEGGDFSDSGSEAVITDQTSSDEEEEEGHHSSEDDFQPKKPKSKQRSTSFKKSNTVKKTNFAKSIMQKINKQQEQDIEENVDVSPALFSVKDLTDTDKLLPMLNLSESDSSDDESPTVAKRNSLPSFTTIKTNESDDDTDDKVEYKDVWSSNLQNDSAEIAKKTFLELEQQKLKIEETKLSVQNYTTKIDKINESDVKDLLALGEEEVPTEIMTKKKKKKNRQDSDSEIEDWEEVKETTNSIPQQGLQLVVDIPNDICRRTKKLDVEMMMKRKINRVKKEYQVYMHKVHVLCWLGHGNYVSQVLNDPTVLAAALSVVPSKDSYPGDRVDMKYLEQITTWFNDKMTINQDRSENKFKPKLPPLKSILLQQIKNKVFTTKKYMVFVFVSMLRSLGLQCRVMFNFVTLPIKPPTSELCSLSTKEKEGKSEKNKEAKIKEEQKDSDKSKTKLKHKKEKIPQLDGNYDSSSEVDTIMQVDGGDDDEISVKTRRQKTLATKKSSNTNIDEDNVSPPKRTRRNVTAQGEKRNDTTTSIKKQKENNLKALADKTCTASKAIENKNVKPAETTRKSLSLNRLEPQKTAEPKKEEQKRISLSSQRTRSNKSVANQTQSAMNKQQSINESNEPASTKKSQRGPKIVVTNENNDKVSSEYFGATTTKETPLGRKRSRTSEPKTSKDNNDQQTIKKTRTRSAHTTTENKSKYFNSDSTNQVQVSTGSVMRSRTIKQTDSGSEDDKRVSHKDIGKKKVKPKNDVTKDLIDIIKGRVKETKIEGKKGIVKAKIKQESDEDSDYLAVESPKSKAGSDDDFKPTKTISKPRTNVKKIDRRVISTDDELPLNKIDVWCEIYVEELEEWVPVDVTKGKVHCVNELYNRATHPVRYVVGWDNNNYLKDLTRRYVPHWNTITRKQRVEAAWWDESIKPWVGPKTARDKEEDERLNRMLLEAPLPKSISEYKNHPLYALKRHLLKFEAIYPPDAAILGFVRSEPVYARDCVYVCKSREIWLKDAKVVKLGEEPYKIVKARPKWDKLSNKMITGKALEIFGPWQVQDYEPPTAENGIVPRNPYGNVELFKECMLPKGTVLLKLHGLNRIAKKLNIDCAPAMTGFDYNGGYCHPVYDGFVVCKEFEDIITEAWLKDQEEQERKEEEKIDARVYGNWRKLIRGLLIKERLKAKYGFEEPSTSKDKIKAKGPRLVVKKK